MIHSIAALHNAARRYCIERIAHWHEVYAALVAARKNRLVARDGSWTYTEQAYRTFPRYNVLEAILAEVERFVPKDFPSLEETRVWLAAKGQTAQSSFTRPSNATEATAMAEERAAFVRFVEQSSEQSWAAAPPLPFRRVLAADEGDRLYQSFCARWGNWYGGAVDQNPLAPCLTLRVEWLDALPGKEQALRGILAARGIQRLLELREHGNSFELDLDAAGFTYNGAEGFWFVRELDWMLYASHEASLTLGGEWLVAAARSAAPDIERYLYRG